MRRLSVLVAFLLACLPLRAHAQDKLPLAVLELDDSAKLSREFVTEATGAVVALLQREPFASRYKVVRGDKLSGVLDLFACEPGVRCFDKISQSLKAKALLYSAVTRKGELYTLSVGFYSQEKAAMPTPLTREGLRASEVSGALAALVSEALGVPPSARLLVTVKPLGASVVIDGEQPALSAPVVKDLPPGTHEVWVTEKSYQAVRQTVELSMGDEKELFFELTPQAPSPVVSRTDASPLGRYLVLGGVGGVLLGAGTGALWFSGRGQAALVNRELGALANSNSAEAELFAGTELDGDRALAASIAAGAAGSRICSGDAADAFADAPDAAAVVRRACRFEALSIPSLVLVAGGAAAIVVGAVAAPAPKEAATLSLLPVVAPDATGLLVRGRF